MKGPASKVQALFLSPLPHPAKLGHQTLSLGGASEKRQAVHPVKTFLAALLLLLRCHLDPRSRLLGLPAWVPCPPPSPHLRGAGQAGVTTPAGQGGSSRLPVHMPETPTHRHSAATPARALGGAARRMSLQGGRAGGGRLRGTCQGRGITSGGFSCFIVKQQKTIYTPTTPLNT